MGFACCQLNKFNGNQNVYSTSSSLPPPYKTCCLSLYKYKPRLHVLHDPPYRCAVLCTKRSAALQHLYYLEQLKHQPIAACPSKRPSWQTHVTYQTPPILRHSKGDNSPSGQTAANSTDLQHLPAGQVVDSWYCRRNSTSFKYLYCKKLFKCKYSPAIVYQTSCLNSTEYTKRYRGAGKNTIIPSYSPERHCSIDISVSP